MLWYIAWLERFEQILEKGRPMKISARNKLHGTIADVVKGATTAHVRIDLGGGAVVTASITNDAVDELKLKKGDKAYAVIKATDVMVGLD
jgi:molybdopterin-binding protein